MLDLSTLKSSRLDNPTITNAFGNGHTIETDPTKKGWKILPVKGATNGILILGRRGVIGCASIIPLDGVRLSVALYDQDPKTVADSTNRGSFDPVYQQHVDISGWALKVIASIERMLAWSRP